MEWEQRESFERWWRCEQQGRAMGDKKKQTIITYPSKHTYGHAYTSIQESTSLFEKQQEK